MPITSQKETSLIKDLNSSEVNSIEKVLFQLKEIPGDHSIAVGLSGGVDSSLTAALLVEANWKVEGLTLWLMSGQGSCCTDGLVDAAGICDQLLIPHHVLDERETFQKEIIHTLVNGYKKGITPLPCSRCNRSVKFAPMINWATKERNLKYIATGHYARVRHSQKTSEQKHQLLRGLDSNKDQSYFLYDLSQEVLAKVIFPLGELTKKETRQAAAKFGLRTANKPESQDLCLVEHHGSMKNFLDKYLPPRKGEIVLNDGTLVGDHDGIEHFTIGQRKGLGVSWEEPLYVIEIQSSSNRVVVAPRSKAAKATCLVGEVNWVSIPPPEKPISIQVQLRYRSHPIKARLMPVDPTESDISNKRPYRCILTFEQPHFSVTPGQAAVFYSGETLLGGGLIQPESS